MASEAFNSLGGYTIGIPPFTVVDANGNITANKANIGNLTAGIITSTGNITAPYFIGNFAGNISGNLVVPGTNTSVLFNNQGNAGASDAFRFNSTTNVVTVTGNIAVTNILTDNYLYANGAPFTFQATAAGSNNQLQFNSNGLLNASTNLTFNSSTNTLGTVNLSAVDASITAIETDGITVNGNVSANYFVGNLVGNVSNANIISANLLTGTLTNNAQPNITSVGTLTSLNVAGNVIPGANNQYDLGTNANRWRDLYLSGNTIYLGDASIEANATAIIFTNPGGSNFVLGGNDLTVVGNITAGGNLSIANITAGNSVTANYFTGTLTTANQPNITNIGTLSNLTVSGNINAANVIAVTRVSATQLSGLVVTASQPNITSVGTLNGLTVSGNISGANWITSSYLSGNGAPITYITGANVVGAVANATYAVTAGSANSTTTSNVANYAGNVTVNAQPNITSVGTLTSLVVSGNISGANWITSNYLSGNGAPITYITGANVVGAVANATYAATAGSANSTLTANVANYAANVTSSAQPNITSVGTLTSLAVSGNITVGNVVGANLISANFLTGTLTTQTQSNIHIVGNLGFLNVDTAISGSNGNITFNGSMSGIGTQSDIDITGNLTAGNVLGTLLTGVITTNEQPNITLLGTLTELNVAGPANLGSISNLTITGGSANYVLSTDGAGTLSWVAQTGGGNGNGTPGGLNTYIQYNDNGAFAGSSNLSWNNSTQMLTVGGNVNILGRANVITLVSSASTGTAPFTVNSTTPVANLAVDTAGTVRDNAQPNITSVGNLTSLVVSGNLSAGNLSLGGAFSVSGNFSAGNISTSGQTTTVGLTVTGNTTLGNVFIGNTKTVNISGTFNTNSSANVNLGDLGNIHIYGGTNGQLLSTDGAGGLTWTTGGGGGNGTPGGSNTQVQYNDQGVFGGSAYFTFNEVTNTLQVAGNLVANSSQMGAGIYKFSTQSVYFATTSSTAPDQLLWSVPAANVSGVDFHIISTDTTDSTRQSSKISTMIYGSNIVWNEYGSLQINGGTGTFSVVYDPGSILAPPTLQLVVTPDSTNSTTYKMMITEYAP